MHNDIHITVGLLRRLHVCEEGCDRFQREFPNGALYSEAARRFEQVGASSPAHAKDREWFDRTIYSALGRHAPYGREFGSP